MLPILATHGYTLGHIITHTYIYLSSMYREVASGGGLMGNAEVCIGSDEVREEGEEGRWIVGERDIVEGLQVDRSKIVTQDDR